MSKRFKKLFGIVMCMVTILSLSMGNTFAEGLFDEVGEINSKVDLSPYIMTSAVVKPSDSDPNVVGELNYSGKLIANVDSVKLFEEVNKLYTDTINEKYGTKVMFGKDRDFPSFTYKVKLPEGVTIDEKNIKVSDNTFTVSEIKKNTKNNEVTFIFHLGNWNDYKTFFEEYRKETVDGIDHRIYFEIPYSGTLEEGTTFEALKDAIKMSGGCELWYFKKLFFIDYKKKIVNIDADEMTLPLVMPMQ